MATRHPRSMYKGSFTVHEINASHEIANDEAQEAALRADGYVDGHEFFSNPPEPTLPKEEEATPPVKAPASPKKTNKPRKPKTAPAVEVGQE